MKQGILLGASLMVAATTHFMDVHSTHAVLQAGGVESNPRVQSLLDLGGVPAFAAFKTILLTALAGASYLLSRMHRMGAVAAYSMVAYAAVPAFVVSIQNYALAARIA